MRERHNFTNTRVENRPHDSVLNRISHNEQVARRGGSGSARAIEQDMARFNPGKPLSDGKVEAPRVTDRLVRPQDAARPTSDVQMPQRELRSKSKAPSPIAAGPGRDMEVQTDRTGDRAADRGARSKKHLDGRKKRVEPPPPEMVPR